MEKINGAQLWSQWLEISFKILHKFGHNFANNGPKMESLILLRKVFKT